jgi:membrane protein
VAFRLFVYLLPLFLALLTLVGLVVGLDEDAPTRVGDGMGMSTYVVQSVADASEQAHRNLWFLVPLALWAVYSAGGAAARVLHAVHTVAWSLPRTRMRRGVAAAGATFLVALGALLAVGISQWLRAESPGLGLGAAAAGIMPFAALWLGVSWLLPHDRRARWTALVPGALLVGTGVWLAHLFSVYVLASRVDKASSMYGSLGVAAALLAWLYLFGRLMVAGAMLNATLWERRSRDSDPAAAAAAWDAPNRPTSDAPDQRPADTPDLRE